MYKIWGKIKKGQNRGKGLGFPTANITLHKKIPDGIYAALVKVDRNVYKAATFIGEAVTFNEKDFKAESYIMDFNKNIYGKWISIRLLKKIRENKKFDTVEKLVEQMRKDVGEVRQFFDDFRKTQNTL